MPPTHFLKRLDHRARRPHVTARRRFGAKLWIVETGPGGLVDQPVEGLGRDVHDALLLQGVECLRHRRRLAVTCRRGSTARPIGIRHLLLEELRQAPDPRRDDFERRRRIGGKARVLEPECDVGKDLGAVAGIVLLDGLHGALPGGTADSGKRGDFLGERAAREGADRSDGVRQELHQRRKIERLPDQA